jgi:hypothetical protein
MTNADIDEAVLRFARALKRVCAQGHLNP